MTARNSKISKELNELGPRLKVLREAAGLSLEKLAVKLQKSGWDVSRVTLHQMEHQKRLLTDVELRLILEALKLGWKDL